MRRKFSWRYQCNDTLWGENSWRYHHNDTLWGKVFQRYHRNDTLRGENSPRYPRNMLRGENSPRYPRNDTLRDLQEPWTADWFRKCMRFLVYNILMSPNINLAIATLLLPTYIKNRRRRFNNILNVYNIYIATLHEQNTIFIVYKTFIWLFHFTWNQWQVNFKSSIQIYQQ